LDCTASTTTMASSTTVPMASTSANSVRILRLNPAATRQANVPTSDTIMEMDGMSVLLRSCKKKYTTRITRIMAITSVSTTLCMEAKRKSLELIIVTNSVPSGRLFLISSICAVICLLTAVALEPAVWNIMKSTAGLLSISLRKL